MDPKTKRIDSGTPSDCERLIERGHLALIAITSEALAARVEAQKAELEVALSESRRGDANMLRNWLENYRGMNESPSVEARHTPIQFTSVIASQFTAPVSTAGEPCRPAVVESEFAKHDESQPAELSWNLLLPAARQRLQTRSSELGLIERSATDASEVAQPPAMHRGSECPIESPIERDVNDVVSEELKVDGEFAIERESVDEDFREDPLDQPDEHEPLVYQELPELQTFSATERDLGKPFFRSGRRGLAFSVLVHSALIGSLMAITMRVPDEVASMGFNAGTSESTAESFEEFQPMEITSTEEISVEMPSETSESSVNLPSAVGLSSSSVNSVTPTSASTISGVQASASRAVAASSGRPNPAHANASFFGAGASGNCFCYVIDGSESMRGGPWEAAKAELLRSLSTMKESHRFYIIFFNQQLNAITMPGEREPAASPLYATAENLRHAQNWIESLRIERGAPPNDALLHAIELEPDAIYLLADGATKIDVPAFLRTKNRTSDFISGEQVRVPIHAIAFYSPESGQKLMKQVAVENKGQFIYVPDPRKK
jgi:hypothetical protein